MATKSKLELADGAAAMAPPAPCHGHDPSTLCTPPKEHVLCCACKRVVDKPFQTPCGHAYCRDFIHSSSGEATCQADGCEGNFRQQDCFQDKALNKEVLRLRAQCPLTTDCPWQDNLGAQAAHIETCGYRSLRCPRCDKTIVARSKEEHDLRCDKMPCKYSVVGCQAKVSKDKSRDHEKQAATVHLDLLWCALLSIVQYGTIVIDPPNDASDEERSFTEESAALSAQRRNTDQQLRSQLDALIESLKKAMTVSKRAAETLQSLVHNALPLIHEEKLRLLRKLEQLNRLSHRADSDERALQERLRNLELASYNGICVFKVDRFHEQRQECIAGNQTRIYSPYFFTSPRGYKLRLVCYLNGDGSGKDTHVSLFIIICKHKYDAILPWPFKYRVTLMCMSQDGSPPLKQAFQPDESSTSFKKPDSEFNVATGCPKFVELRKLAQPSSFLKDDTLLFKCVIDVPEGCD